MKTGDICRCISDFTGLLPEEINVYKNDILQIHSVVDRHWVEAEGGGGVGRVPSSVLVTVDPPKHPVGCPVFVAAADFHPAQAGDLGFARGDFIIGLNPIDDAWWCGEVFGKKGIFPLNFVWKVNEDILEVEDTAEKQVNLKGRVRRSLRAQLPEELDLYTGDIVNITHIVDKDWYRGESNGSTGIFPSDFVEIIETSDVPSLPALSQPAPSSHYISADNYQDPGSDYLTDIPGNTELPYKVNAAQFMSNGSDANSSSVSANIEAPSSDPPAILSKISTHWKTIDANDDMDLLDDAYFKQNLPGLFSSQSNKNDQRTPYDSKIIIPPFNQASASNSFSNLEPRSENISGSFTTDEPNKSSSISRESYFMNRANVQSDETSNAAYRYENINEDEFIKANSDQYDNASNIDWNSLGSDKQMSALVNAQDGSCGDHVNSLSREVEDYFSQNLLNDTENSKLHNNNNIHSNIIKQYSTLSSPGYNEDNTGIEPYGKAIFSFRAQYPNELTFKKGDIVHLLKHVDSHWTLGRIGNSKGIFPTSYVDIIVNCLHNEEEMFLARADTMAQAYLGYAKAEYSFEGVKAGDVTMSKGDLLKVIKFVDDNWVIVENINGSKGMCPQNYLSMLFELNSKPEETAFQVPNTSSEESCRRESRQLIQTTPSSRSRSTSPYNKISSKRSYNKDDFGNIQQQEVESVLAKNIASLDITCKSTYTDKRESESVFTEREISELKTKSETEPPVIPLRVSRSLSGGAAITSSDPSKSEELPSIPVKKPTVAPRTLRIPPVPPRVIVGKRNSVKSVLDEDNQIVTSSESLASKLVPLEPPVEPIYSKVQKPQAGKKSSNKLQLQLSRKASGSGQLSRGDSANSASFPDDVSNVSLNNEGTYASEAQNGNTSPAILPQRPAPPPPPKLCESALEENEEYYSLPPQGESDITCTSVKALHMDNATSKVTTSVDDDDGDDNGRYEIIDEEVVKSEEEVIENKEVKPKVNMRRELMQEIVTTEHEYIHDLEALMQVIRLAPSQKESRSVDLNALMGNISQVVSAAKKLLSHLDSVAYDTDENLQIGRVFLLCAPDLCDVYKIYCSNHNVAAEPLLKKYAQEPDPAAFLQWVLSELQQHKIQLMDMRSVLIKPVQRVLKYPLFLDRLVSQTSPDHVDYEALVEAKTKMANVAKEINEYTKRLDLINKYRGAVDQSLQSKMQRVSMHSVAKKSARLSAIVSEKLGIMTTTKDPDFDEEETKFHCVQRAALAFVQDLGIVLQGIKARHKAELEIAKALVATLIEGARTPAIEAIQKTTLETCNRLLHMFENFVNKRISYPANQLVSLCEVPERLIVKRYHKLLDFDNAQYKLDRNKDPTRTRILEEELSQAKGTYEALNTQLMMELPVLSNAGLEMLTLSTRSLVAARMYLQGHLAKLYLQLAQIPGLTYSGEEEMLSQFRVKYLHQVGEFRHLSFIPAESLQRSLPRTKSRGRKSIENAVKNNATEGGTKRKVLSKYPSDVIYVVAEVHTPGEVMELTLYPGDHVALLKNKDPLGKSDRWFVDDGDNKGFVRASCLRHIQGPENRAGVVTALPSSINTAVPLPTPGNPLAPPRPSTLPRAAPTPPLPERPPRYEDLFPTITSAPPRPPQSISFPRNGQQPPPRYSMGQEINPPTTQTMLPSKPGRRESCDDRIDRQEPESYYSPPLDRQQSNEYNSPVSEESNIYEEIEQGREEQSEKPVIDETDGSPIYEIIEDDGMNQASHPQGNSGASPLPESEYEEPQFYYALYNFGGSDSTQLNLSAGQVVMIIQGKSSDWWFVEDRNGHQGYVPASYLTKYT
ncbi:dynamin-binding protein-like [Palaemon carinicauda]|uniref:dynamin-binding protein-like n=1 Tax=Palaemon carinicauda TaxID=392227 RepID=UPI0035B659CB